MDLEQKVGLFLIGAMGALIGFIGVCHASIGNFGSGLFLALLGFVIEAFAVKSFVEGSSK